MTRNYYYADSTKVGLPTADRSDSSLARKRKCYSAGRGPVAMDEKLCFSFWSWLTPTLRVDGLLFSLLGDYLGSTSLTTHANGQVHSEMKYMPYGEMRLMNRQNPTDVGYIGHYDSSLGRFVEADAIVPLAVQGVQAWDRYAYVNNSPVRYNDPSGRVYCDFWSENCVKKAKIEQRLLASSVRIKVTNNVDANIRLEGYGTGTVVNNDTVVTHAHWEEVGESFADIDGLSIQNSKKGAVWDQGVVTTQYEKNQPFWGLFAGRRKAYVRTISTENDLGVQLAELASIEEIKGIQNEDLLQVVYYADDVNTLAVVDLRVTGKGRNYLRLDNNGLLNHGDSGGGVFLNGRLIGNISAISRDGGTVAYITPNPTWIIENHK